MPFVPPFTFVDGNSLQASDLEGSFQAARDYINGGVVAADYGSQTFEARHLLEGEPSLSWDDRSFETGGHHLQSLVVTDSTRRRYVTGTMKASDITQQVVYQHIHNASVRVWMDAPGDLWVEGYGYVVALDPGNSTLAYEAKTTPAPNVVDSRFYLEVDGTVEQLTRNYHFCENAGAPSAQSIASGLANFGSESLCRRPLYMFWCFTGLSAGWHTVRLVCDPRSEVVYVGEDSWQWEVLSDGGLTSYVGSDYIYP